MTSRPLLVRKFPSGEKSMQFKEESNVKLSLPRHTLYSCTPVSALKSSPSKSLSGRIQTNSCSDLDLPEPCSEAGVPGSQKICFFRTPSKSSHPASKVFELLSPCVEFKVGRNLCVSNKDRIKNYEKGVETWPFDGETLLPVRIHTPETNAPIRAVIKF